jgi:hypothetical protein
MGVGDASPLPTRDLRWLIRKGSYWMERCVTRRRAADARATDLAPIIAELRAAGAESLRAIAAGLNARGIPTARGGEWSAVQVARVIGRQVG